MIVDIWFLACRIHDSLLVVFIEIAKSKVPFHCMYYFDCLGFSSHTRILSLIWSITITESSLACQNGTTVYNVHLRELVTLTHIAERLAVELSLPVSTISVSRSWDSNTQLSTCGANPQTDCATAQAHDMYDTIKISYYSKAVINKDIVINQITI